MSPVTRLQTLRGTTAQRISFIPLKSELVYDTDLNVMYCGDGVTYGGIPFSGEGPPLNINIYTVDTILTVDDYAIANSAGSIEFTLPDATGFQKAIRVKNAGVGLLTVSPVLGQLIDGNSDIQLLTTNALVLVPKSGAWYIW